jgi:hypothetical protein
LIGLGLGCVKTKVPPVEIGYFGTIVNHESQIMLRTKCLIGRMRIIFFRRH